MRIAPILVVLLLTACGQAGPLVLPDAAPAQAPAPPAPEAPADEEKKDGE